MGDRWSGLYLQSPPSSAFRAVSRLARSRGYHLLDVDPNVHYPWIEAKETARLHEIRLSFGVDPAFVVDAGRGWARLIGFERVDVTSPRLFFASEVVALLGCRAFEVGFLNTHSWWCCAYEEGLPIDRFDSDPIESVLAPSAEDAADPNDPRTAFLRWSGLEHIHRLPPKILDQFRGNPSVTAGVLGLRDPGPIEAFFGGQDGPGAIRTLAEKVGLLYMGRFDALGLFDQVTNVALPPPPPVQELLQIEILGLVAIHPSKVSLFDGGRG